MYIYKYIWYILCRYIYIYITKIHTKTTTSSHANPKSLKQLWPHHRVSSPPSTPHPVNYDSRRWTEETVGQDLKHQLVGYDRVDFPYTSQCLLSRSAKLCLSIIFNHMVSICSPCLCVVLWGWLRSLCCFTRSRPLCPCPKQHSQSPCTSAHGSVVSDQISGGHFVKP